MKMLYVHNNLKKTNLLINELSDPIDIAYANVYKTFNLFAFQNPKEGLDLLDKVENQNKLWQNMHLQNLLDLYYFMYYNGFNRPIVDKEKAEIRIRSAEESLHKIRFVDSQEEWMTLAFFHLQKALYEIKRENIQKAVKLNQEAIKYWSKMEDDMLKTTFVALAFNNLGDAYRKLGEFKNAEKAYLRALDGDLKYNTFWQLWRLYNLALLARLQGDLGKARKWNDQRLNASKHFNNIYGLYGSLTLQANLLNEEGRYDEALQSHEESLDYRKQYKEPLQIFLGYYNILTFYNSHFIATQNQTYLNEAEKILFILEETKIANPKNSLISNFTNFAKAQLLKHGNMRKKGKAVELLEQLLEIYPRNQEMILNLLELLFEDANAFGDSETISQIDALMEKINNLPLRGKPQAVIEFVSQQIIIAKYTYYIKGDVTLAINILNTTKEDVSIYKLAHLITKIDQEISSLENNVKKWNKLLESADDVNNRIKQADFQKYIKDVQKFKSKY